MPRSARIKYIKEDFRIGELDHELWESADAVKIKSNWSGAPAPKKRRFATKLLWSDTALYVKFVANQGEPPNINKFPKHFQKTDRLWERDVCELFVAPFPNEPHKYFEFEIAPTGEWIDLEIELLADEQKTNPDYCSGMKTASRIGYDEIVMAFKVEWTALRARPSLGDVWKGNLMRCVGRGKTRGYLSWSATRTDAPNFHVPERFGDFQFVR